MEHRWFNLVVVLVWLSTTSWLVVSKVLPPLRRGEPPNYWSMYSRDEKEQEAVAWDMSLNGNSVGSAVSWLTHQVAEITEVHSHIHFQHIPLAELSPAWMKVLLKQTVEPVEMDAYSKLIIDTLGHLTSFHSILRVPGIADSINISGRVQGSLLRIEVQSNEIAPIYLPPDALVADELSPQSRLENLHVGQEWTVPVFSPLRPPLNPVDILQARVESRDVLMWDGETVSVFVVVYRADSGSAQRDPRETLGSRRRYRIKAASDSIGLPIGIHPALGGPSRRFNFCEQGFGRICLATSATPWRRTASRRLATTASTAT